MPLLMANSALRLWRRCQNYPQCCYLHRLCTIFVIISLAVKLLKTYDWKTHAVVICQEFLDRRKMTEWGSLALVDEGEGDVAGKSISLPGVRSGDLSSRHWKPEVRVSCVQFSPTGSSLLCLYLC